MAEADVFGEDNRLELLDGEIVRMTPIGSHHAGCVNRLNRLLTAAVGTDAGVSVQNRCRKSHAGERKPQKSPLSARHGFCYVGASGG